MSGAETRKSAEPRELDKLDAVLRALGVEVNRGDVLELRVGDQTRRLLRVSGDQSYPFPQWREAQK